MKTIGIIPCRYQSSRFPGKPLALINDKPMMWHVYQRALESGALDEVYIATDDERIIEVANEYSLNVVMTSDKHETGIDRVAEVAGQLQEGYYVNIQGDEPFIKPEAIKLVARAIIDCDNPVVLATNANTPIQEVSENSPANVEKVEGVEMYRLIEHGYSIQMVKTNDSSILVDTPSDLKHVQEKFVSF